MNFEKVPFHYGVIITTIGDLTMQEPKIPVVPMKPDLPPNYAERFHTLLKIVEEEAIHLDQYMPDWYCIIDIDMLDVASDRYDIFGMLLEANHNDAYPAMHNTNWNAHIEDDDFDVTTMWLVEISMRRVEAYNNMKGTN